MTQPTEFTKTIPADRLPELEEMVEKLNRRARRADLPETTIVQGERHYEDIYFRRLREKVAVEFVAVTVTVGFVNFGGWTLLGVLEPTDTGNNIVKAIPGHEVPIEYRTRWTCDHCGDSRHRSKTYVVANEETGEVKQLGSTCLRSFLPNYSVEAYAETLEDVIENLGGYTLGEDDEDIVIGGKCRAFYAAEFLAKVNALIAKSGWLSRTAARNQGRESTVDAVIFSIWSKYEKDKIIVSEADVAEAQAMIDETIAILVAKGERNLSDYEWNLLNAARSELVSTSQAGVFGSLAQYISRIRVERAAAETGQHVGKVGERLTFTVSVVDTSERFGDFGITHIFNMTDEAGNLVVWFASNPCSALKPGATVKLTGTVKAHKVYNGKPQTVVTRCKVAAAN